MADIILRQNWIIRRNVRRQRIIRDKSNPFDVFSPREIKERYRYSQETILWLAAELIELEHPTRKNNALPPFMQLLIALRFYACGSFLQPLGDGIYVDKSTVSRTLRRVSVCLSRRSAEYIRFPTTGAEQQKAMQDFFEVSGKYNSFYYQTTQNH